jgi:oligopeptide/dipeptide ABC transporter ATP-binding protein
MSPTRATLSVLALWLAGLGAAAQFGKISVIYDDLVAVYGSAPAVAVMVSVVGMVGLVFGTTAGIVVQRLGLRRVIVAALLLGAALSAVQALLPPLPLMLGARVLEGLSHLAIVVVGPVMIAQAAAPRWQGLAMTLWSSFFGVSYAGLAVIGPQLAGWRGAEALFADPRHPYTNALLDSIPPLDGPRPHRLHAIEGAPPSLLALPQGCAFAPRCPRAFAACSMIPALRGTDHAVACHLEGAE